MTAISIICAVYNAQNTIKRCIDSILSQTVKGWELLLIDDGSTDDSPKICDEYASRDNRIKVIHKKNEGVAATRQCGIDIAQGEYMMHVDPDDWIENNTLELMYNSVRSTNSLIAICDYSLIDSSGVTYKEQKPERMDSISMMDGIFSGKLLGGVCNKLIHRDLYKLGGGKFRPNINYCEDVLFLSEICDKQVFPVSHVNKALYNYDKSAGTSITSSKFTRKKYFSYRAFNKALRETYSRLTFQQYADNLGDIVVKVFTSNILSGREFYHEFKSERRALKAMKCNRQLKLLIIFSSYGLYPVCRLFYRAYLNMRK